MQNKAALHFLRQRVDGQIDNARCHKKTAREKAFGCRNGNVYPKREIDKCHDSIDDLESKGVQVNSKASGANTQRGNGKGLGTSMRKAEQVPGDVTHKTPKTHIKFQITSPELKQKRCDADCCPPHPEGKE